MCNIAKKITYCTIAFLIGCVVAMLVPLVFAAAAWFDPDDMPYPRDKLP